MPLRRKGVTRFPISIDFPHAVGEIGSKGGETILDATVVSEATLGIVFPCFLYDAREWQREGER